MIARNPLKAPELEAMARCPGEDYTPAPTPSDIAAVQGQVISIKFTATKRGKPDHRSRSGSDGTPPKGETQ